MKTLLAVSIFLLATSTMGQSQVDGYIKRDGTYVAPHMRTDPNSTKQDNYSSRGNVNPYTGQAGTVDPYKQPTYQVPTYQAPSYGSPTPRQRNPY